VTNALSNFPDLVAEWHPTLNGGLTPDRVVAGSHQKAWWRCSVNPDHDDWHQVIQSRTLLGRGCSSCAGHGYNPSKPGTVYVLSGDRWGKVGISNALAGRLAKHTKVGVFGALAAAVEFRDGRHPLPIERSLCEFISKQTNERAPKGVDGYTESFPIALLSEVVAEMRRLLTQVDASEWTVLTIEEPL
jgi:hypothetical protein